MHRVSIYLFTETERLSLVVMTPNKHQQSDAPVDFALRKSINLLTLEVDYSSLIYMSSTGEPHSQIDLLRESLLFRSVD